MNVHKVRRQPSKTNKGIEKTEGKRKLYPKKKHCCRQPIIIITETILRFNISPVFMHLFRFSMRMPSAIVGN